MISLKGTCKFCGKVYYWTDYKTTLGKTLGQIEDIRFRWNHCKYCHASGLEVEQDVETEVGKVYHESEVHATAAISEVIEEMRQEVPDLGIRMDDRFVPCGDCCPRCGKGPLDGTTGMDVGSAAKVSKNTHAILPEDGDVTICCYCTALLFFIKRGNRLNLRPATPEEQTMLLENPQVRLMILSLKNIQGHD